MAKVNEKSPDYKTGYKRGYQQGYQAGRTIDKKPLMPPSKAYWIMRKDGWYCSNCQTKHNQAHDDFCCKCGRKMSEEADYEDN